ncbi:high-affinity nicotinic acid transporter [Trichomonascus vanleenenianus]|uniref:high-affinity nicotinic acid transporter n=1 Tax=Trichomonascus vanleenenianus TaxID=2268995 RepID=UPI003ECBA7C2
MDPKEDVEHFEAGGTTTQKYERPHLGKWEELFQDMEAPAPGTEERKNLERKLKWKLDLTILPLVFLMYILNYLDRNNLAAAKLGTIEKDLNINSSQFATAQGVLFIGYILASVPANVILERIGRPSKFIPGAMLIWGLISTCVGSVNSFGGLVACRILLGAFESVFYPGVIFYLSCWYTRREIAKRSSLFVAGSWLSGAFSGLIAYGVLDNMDGTDGRAAWRWLFIIEGVATMGVAIISMIVLPELPATTWWLSREERLIGVVRMTEDVGTADDDSSGDTAGEEVSALYGLKLAVTDKKVILFWCLLFCTTVSAGVNTVFPTIVDSLGFDREKTLLLTAPPWVLCTITSVINSFHSDITGERFWHIVVGPAIALAAFIIGIATTQTAARYVCMMLILQIYTSYSLMYAWIVNNIPRPPVKRAAAIALINIGANIPNIWVPYLYSFGSPHFYAGFGVCIAFLVGCLTMLFVIRFYLNKLNQKLDRGEMVDGLDPATGFRFFY